MKYYSILSCSLLLASAAFIFPFSLHALDIDQSSNIFNFQHKLALNGNEHAQYRLASMYETGDGTEVDIEQAKHWYGLAAKAGLKAASNRETYLRIKEQGFNQARDAEWLAGVKADASEHDAEAVFLLGQLYRQGLGVEKDLNKSLELFKQDKILSNANVETEIAKIHAEIAARDKAIELAKIREIQKNRLVEQAQKIQKKDEKLELQAQKEKQAEVERLEKAEKIRRYEEARMKLRREQQLIDEQQSRVTGGASESIDDEI